MRDTRYVVFHRPGPRWVAGKPLFEQDGVREHVAHFGRPQQEGRLELGGPFVDDAAGGMMIPAAGVPHDEIVAFAEADPAVVSGLLRVEVREWLIGMRR